MTAGVLTSAVPILPARDVERTAGFYRDQLGFSVVHTEPEYGIVERDAVEIHFWGPSGIAPEETDGMCRVEVEGIDELYADCRSNKLVHPNAPLEDKPWGTREFAILDVDGNPVTFYEPGSTDPRGPDDPPGASRPLPGRASAAAGGLHPAGALRVPVPCPGISPGLRRGNAPETSRRAPGDHAARWIQAER